jgi:hypothetical protein
VLIEKYSFPFFAFSATGGGGEVLVGDQRYCTENYPMIFFETGYIDGERLENWVKKYNTVEVEIVPGGITHI